MTSHEGQAPQDVHLREGKVPEFWDTQDDQYAADEFRA